MSTIYQLTRDQLLTAAVHKFGLLAKGQTLDAEDIARASVSLNTLVAYLRGKSLPLWARKEYEMTLTAGVAEYEIGVGKTLNTPYPLKMIQAYSEGIITNSRIPIDIISDREYNLMPWPNTAAGQPVQLAYQPKVNSGIVKIWPAPNAQIASQYKITLIYQRPFEYFSAGTDTLDMPEEWYLPVIYKLAVLLAPEWGVPLEDRRMLMTEAKEYLDMIDGFGQEEASIYFTPNR